MAGTHVEQERSKRWIGVIAALVVLSLVAWWFLGRGDDRIADAGTTPAVIADSAAGSAAFEVQPDGPVGAFIAFDDSVQAGARMSLDHVHTATGLRRLADAIEQVANTDSAGGASLAAPIDSLRAAADALERDTTSTRHATASRDAFLRGAALIRGMQMHRWPDRVREASMVIDAAKAIDPDTLLLEQRAAVQAYFDNAAAALRVMRD